MCNKSLREFNISKLIVRLNVSVLVITREMFGTILTLANVLRRRVGSTTALLAFP